MNITRSIRVKRQFLPGLTQEIQPPPSYGRDWKVTKVTLDPFTSRWWLDVTLPSGEKCFWAHYVHDKVFDSRYDFDNARYELVVGKYVDYSWKPVTLAQAICSWCRQKDANHDRQRTLAY